MSQVSKKNNKFVKYIIFKKIGYKVSGSASLNFALSSPLAAPFHCKPTQNAVPTPKGVIKEIYAALHDLLLDYKSNKTKKRNDQRLLILLA